MNDARVLDATANPTRKARDRFGSRRTSSVQPRSSTPHQSTLPKTLTHPTESEPAIPQPAAVLSGHWPVHR